MSETYELPAVDRLVVGTVGPPGQRVFYLQARQGRRLVTLKLEKAHVAELSNRLLAYLEDRAVAGEEAVDAANLETPIETDFVVGSLALAFDEDAGRVLLIAEELVDEGEEDGAVARIGASVAQIAALARHGADLVTAGRPTCRLCGYPIDPEGHVCPRSNGHGPPKL